MNALAPVNPRQARRDHWRANLEALGGTDGFYRDLGPDHKAVYVKKGSTLVVTFENLDDARQSADRTPWGMDFMTSKGRSCLGLMAHGPTWYRATEVYDFFNDLQREGFFDQFENVVFYGGSMGGYGAAAFSAACPGSHVIAVNPQATLDRDVTVGWETRYKKVWTADFKSQYGNGAVMSKTARKVTLLFDPMIPQDAAHAALFNAPNVQKIRCRHFGHGLLTTMRHIGVLGKVVNGIIEETITPAEIYALLRARTRTPFYQKRLLTYLEQHNRHDLAEIYGRAVVRDSAPRGRPHFARAHNRARAALGKPPISLD